MSDDPSSTVSAADVEAATEVAATLLEATRDRTWSTIEPELGRPVAEVVAHQAQACLWYAVDVSARGGESRCLEARSTPSDQPGDQIDALRTGARLLAAAIQAAPVGTRGYHPFGQADPCGFAAMGCDEILVHTADVAALFALDFEPDGALAGRVLRRLFPWAPADVDPWDGLRWANGRRALPDRPRLTRWRWHCTPLDEWDGQPPARQR